MLTKKESKEPMMVTWGRIHQIVDMHLIGVNLDRFVGLVEKFNKDISRAKIEENYFKGGDIK